MKDYIKNKMIILVACLGLITSTLAWPEIAIIVHPSNTNSLDMNDIRRIYLGKTTTFPNGGQVISIDQQQGHDIRINFNRTVLNKSERQVKTYWAQMLFTGKGTPPRMAKDDAEVIKLVSENPALLGYVNASSVDHSVKVAIEF